MDLIAAIILIGLVGFVGLLIWFINVTGGGTDMSYFIDDDDDNHDL